MVKDVCEDGGIKRAIITWDWGSFIVWLEWQLYARVQILDNIHKKVAFKVRADIPRNHPIACANVQKRFSDQKMLKLLGNMMSTQIKKVSRFVLVKLASEQSLKTLIKSISRTVPGDVPNLL